MTQELNVTVALFLLRLITGILFFFQGYDKLFNVKIENVVSTFSDSFRKTLLSGTLLKTAILISSWIEMIGGILLALGLFRDISLYVLGINLVLVAFVFSAIKPMWDMQYFFPRMIFVIILLMIPSQFDCWTIDRWLK